MRQESWLDNTVLDFQDFLLFGKYCKLSNFLFGALLFPIWLLRGPDQKHRRNRQGVVASRKTKKAEMFLKESMLKMAQCQSIIEVGSGRPFEKELVPYCGLFANCNWKTLDIRPEAHPNIVDDITQSRIATASVDGVVCKSIFEHIAEAQKAADEIYRILKPRGRIFSYVPFLHPYHATQKYGDYYRFSAEGIKHLLRHFAAIEVCATEAPLSSILGILLGPELLKRLAHIFVHPLDSILLRKGWMSKTTSGYYVYAEK